MKTADGWVRGKECGKSVGGVVPLFACSYCDRPAETKAALCYPVKLTTSKVPPLRTR